MTCGGNHHSPLQGPSKRPHRATPLPVAASFAVSTMIALSSVAALVATVAMVSSAGPISPPWPSPAPAFPSSWFGANTKTYEFNDPKELAVLKKYKHALASWPELQFAYNFSNATSIATDDAEALKMLLGPSTPIFTYQSAWLAAGYYDEIWAIMHRPEFRGYFLLGPSGAPLNDTTYCSQMRTTADVYPRCLAYFWNWCNSSAVGFYLDNVLLPMIATPNGKGRAFDGVFLDNSDGFNPRGSINAKCDARNASLNVHIQTGRLFQKYAKWPIFSLTGTALDVIDPLWDAGVGYTQFVEYFAPTNGSMAELYTATTRGVPTLVHAPTSVKRHPGIPLLSAVAAYLVSAGGATHSYFQYSSQDWTSDRSWPWSTLYEQEYGEAVGPPIVTNYGANLTGVKWTRHFSKGAVATVDCAPCGGSLPRCGAWCVGNVTFPTAGASADVPR